MARRASNLHSSIPPQSSTPERRRHDRYPAEIAVDFGDDQTFLFSYIDNISEMGIFIRSATPPPVGSRLTLRFRNEKFRLDLEGEVTWHNPVKLGAENLNPGMGIKFRSMSPEQREQVVEIIRTVAYLDRTPKN